VEANLVEPATSVLIDDSVVEPPALIVRVAGPQEGATVLFLGTVRDTNQGRRVTGIDYSAYVPMAVGMVSEIIAEARARFGADGIAVQHRLGRLSLGDVSVGVAVSHAHRGAAFDAAQYMIEELKRRAPIWKREHYVDGSREWVEQTESAARAE
jgi:molybdopterin synthase catalytic subunit